MQLAPAQGKAKKVKKKKRGTKNRQIEENQRYGRFNSKHVSNYIKCRGLNTPIKGKIVRLDSFLKARHNYILSIKSTLPIKT